MSHRNADDAAATDKTARDLPCPVEGRPCAIMPLGDSITQGALSTHGGGYRVPLFRLAVEDGQSITFVGDAEPNGPATVAGVTFPRAHEGHGGFTIETGARHGISPLVEASMLRNKPDIVTLMIGTNDVGLGVDDLPSRLGRLVDRILATDPHVLLIMAQIVPTAMPSHNATVRAYNAAVANVAKTRGDAGKHVVLVDMYTPFIEAAGFPASVLADDLHPNDAGYEVLAQRWYSVLRPFLP
jgi:lysophospholipase L1-like esterase